MPSGTPYGRLRRKDDYPRNTLATDITRLLDPSYAGTATSSSSSSLSLAQYPRSMSSCNVRVYVDSDGELHDPDYRDFPVFPAARAPRSRSLGRRHTVTGPCPTSWARSELNLGSRTRWDARELSQDLEEQDSGSDSEEDAYRPCRARTASGTRSSSMARAASPVASSIYSAVSHMYLDSASITSAPAVLDRDDPEEGKEWEGGGGLGRVDARVLHEEPISGFASEANVVDLASPVEEGRSSTGRWSFLRRMMCTPSHEPPSPLEEYERSHGTRHVAFRKKSTRPQNRLRIRRFRSSSNLPSPPTPRTARPTIAVFSLEKEETEEVEVINEYLIVDDDIQEDTEFPQFPADREAPLRRRVREMNLHVQTRLWRAKKDISTKMRYPTPNISTAPRRHL